MQFAMGPALRTAVRSFATLVALLALVVVAGYPGLTTSAWAASGEVHPVGARTATTAAPRKVVIVVGPFGSLTAPSIAEARTMAASARDHGMTVTTILAPHATWRAVVAAANDADLFVYLGHGNGWPSPYPPFREEFQDGLGLDPTDGAGLNDVKYYGATEITKHIHFARNAIVLLHRACYASGDGEPGMPIPSQAVAVQRVDDFASGFLAAGARTVFALRIQPGEDLIDALVSTHETMEGFFESRFGANRDGSYKAYYGWVGQKPDLYFDSQRTPGARIHLDPDHAVTGASTGPLDTFGYQRAVTGDLAMTTDQWLSGSGGGDAKPPVISGLAAGGSAGTVPAGDGGLPVFTPNGDGIADTLAIRHTLSEGAYLDISVARSGGGVVRHFSDWSDAGTTSSTWDGRSGSGKVVPDGRYHITVVPTDRAGNVGHAATISVRVLTAMKAPAVAPSLFYPTDGDALAATSRQSLTLTQPARLTWRILDAGGATVRTGIAYEALPAGRVSWTWDGLDDTGALAPLGVYTSLVTATTAAGSYSNKLTLRLMPFELKGSLSVTAGQKVRLTLLAAEPMSGWPHIDIRQPGLASYRLYDIRHSATRFTATWTVKAGASGPIRITVSGTDTGGGAQSQVLSARLR